MHVTAIVLAAGEGARLGSRIFKPLVKINSWPLIIYCLKTLSRHTDIKDIIVVANSKNLKGIKSQLKRCRIRKIRTVVLGGRRRQDSVRNGLKAIARRADLVLIHDGVRPFMKKREVSTLIKEAKRSGAAILGVPVKDTIKEVVSCQLSVISRGTVKKTLNRRNLWEIQTPQVFKKNLILQAYRRFGKCAATDDAMLIEKLGKEVSIVPGSYNNIKITTPEDLVIAEAIAQKWNTA